MTSALPPFPPSPALPPEDGLRRAGLTVRAATPDRLAFLRALYATTRADELALVPWPDSAKVQFLDSQFALQHRHFVTHFTAGDFLIVSHRRNPIGRFYVDRSGEYWRIIDIALLPKARGAGHGATLIRWLQRAARTAGAAGVDLHVLHANPRAARLYARLGFGTAIDPSPTHQRMVWSTLVS